MKKRRILAVGLIGALMAVAVFFLVSCDLACPDRSSKCNNPSSTKYCGKSGCDSKYYRTCDC